MIYRLYIGCGMYVCVCVLPSLFILMSGCSPGYQGGDWYYINIFVTRARRKVSDN